MSDREGPATVTLAVCEGCKWRHVGELLRRPFYQCRHPDVYASGRWQACILYDIRTPAWCPYLKGKDGDA